MKTTEKGHFFDDLAVKLRKAAVELEEFQGKADKGKAEVMDKYEDAKEKFKTIVEDAKTKIEAGQKKYEEVNTKLDELRVQLALGKAETKEAFLAQKKKILDALHELEVKIKTNEVLTRFYAFMLVEIEKFKVQLEILEPKFDKGKEYAKSSFEKGKKEFDEFIDKLNIKLGKKEESQWDHFQNEISEAFSHFKNAFSKP
ncbi:MAG: hypothetical protein HKO96_05035 [Flavobacteriaceae bacterium]|nr:hypothetical protein [Flavobacteriaceae bacterium]